MSAAVLGILLNVASMHIFAHGSGVMYLNSSQLIGVKVLGHMMWYIHLHSVY